MALKILLADDSMNPQKMGKQILSDAGYEVVVVSNGAAAVKKIAEIKPDIAVLDVLMPGYTGVEVCEKIRSNEDRTTASMPVLLTIGKMEMGGYNVADGNKVKADGLVIKPFEASDLLAAVQKLAAKLNPQAVAVPAAPANSRYEKTVVMQRPPVLEEFQDESYAQWKTEAAAEPEASEATPAVAAFAAAIPEEPPAPAATPAVSSTAFEDTIKVGPPPGTRESASEIDLDADERARQRAKDDEIRAAAAAATEHMRAPNVVVPPQPAHEFGVEPPSATPAYDFHDAPTVPAMDLGSVPKVVESPAPYAPPAFNVSEPAHEQAPAAAFDPFATASTPAADPFATMISAPAVPAESVPAPVEHAPEPVPAADPFAAPVASADPFAVAHPAPAADPFATMISGSMTGAPPFDPFAGPPIPLEAPEVHHEAPAVEAFTPEANPVDVAPAPGFESHAVAPVDPVVTPESGLESTMHPATPEHAVAPDPAFISDPHQSAKEFTTKFGISEPETTPAPAEPVPEAPSFEVSAPEVDHPAAALEEHRLTDEHASFEAGIAAPPVEIAAPEVSHHAAPEPEAAAVAEPEAPALDPEEEARLLAMEMHAAVEQMPVAGGDTPFETPVEAASHVEAPAQMTRQVEAEVARGIAAAIGAESAPKTASDRELMVRVVRRVLDQELPTLLYQIMTEYDREKS